MLLVEDPQRRCVPRSWFRRLALLIARDVCIHVYPHQVRTDALAAGRREDDLDLSEERSALAYSDFQLYLVSHSRGTGRQELLADLRTISQLDYCDRSVQRQD